MIVFGTAAEQNFIMVYLVGVSNHRYVSIIILLDPDDDDDDVRM